MKNNKDFFILVLVWMASLLVVWIIGNIFTKLVDVIVLIALFVGAIVTRIVFENMPAKPRYINRPEINQILVYFDSAPFEIERDGMKLRLVMMKGLPYSEIGMYVCEPNIALDKAFMVSGLDGKDIIVLSDKQVLKFSRSTAGIKVWWADSEKPWNVVLGK
jgi:hypothetical protein